MIICGWESTCGRNKMPTRHVRVITEGEVSWGFSLFLSGICKCRSEPSLSACWRKGCLLPPVVFFLCSSPKQFSFCSQYLLKYFSNGLKVCQITSRPWLTPKHSVEGNGASHISWEFLSLIPRGNIQSYFWKKGCFGNHSCSKRVHNTWRIIAAQKVGARGTWF